jgi:hypothetical protein
MQHIFLIQRITQQEINNDSVSNRVNNYFSAIRTRSLLESEPRYHEQPVLRSVPPLLEMDYTRYLNKPFLIKTLSWPTSAAAFSSLGTITLPYDLYLNDFLKVPFFHSAMFRARGTVYLQVAGTPLHQGILLAASQALCTVGGGNTGNRLYVNNYMNAPHSFLLANNASSIGLEAPFYVNSKLLRCDSNANDVVDLSASAGNTMCQIDVMVLNPLVAPTSGSTILTVTVHIVLEDLEFYVPWSEIGWVSQSCDYCDIQPAIECCNDCSNYCWCKLGTPAVSQTIDSRRYPFRTPNPTPAPASPKTASSIWSRFTGMLSTTLDSLSAGVKRVTGDFIDLGRSTIREYTGLHNGNRSELITRQYVQTRVPLNTVDTTTVFEKLDPYSNYDRITRDFTYDTSLDEMDIQTIVCKPQYLSTFSVSVGQSDGQLLFSRPITPIQEVQLVNGTPLMTANAQILAYFTRFWRGGIKLHIQSDMTNFHYCKLAVFRNYSPHTQQATTTPAYNDVQGLLIEYLEFSGGGQVQTIDLPFCSLFNTLECSRDWTYNAFQHGMYYIYLVQPLVVSGTVSTTVNFNVYYSLDEDFQFYGYASDPAYIVDPSNAFSIAKKQQKVEEIPAFSDPELNAAPSGVLVEELSHLASGYVSQATMIPGQDDQDLIKDSTTTSYSTLDAENFRPLTSMRDLFRRMTPVDSITISAAGTTTNLGVFIISIADLIGIPNSGSGVSSSLQCLRRFYLGMDGGLKVKLRILGASNASVTFAPPGTYVNTTSGLRSAYSTTPITNNDSTVRSTGLGNFQYTSTTTMPQLPRQELTNYYQNLSGQYVNQTGASGTAASYAASECVLDIIVPNMNPCRYIGDSSGYMSDLSIETDMVNALGHLVVSLKLTPIVNTSTLVFHPVLITPYIGLTDESRLGFQIKSPTLQYPVVTGNDTNVYLVTTFSQNYAADVSPLADPRASTPACYIG